MSALRPLPARPSLAFERKEAKALLRRLRAGDPEAVARARARHPTLPGVPDRIHLSDAQLVLAREYGFASWPRLVRYFGDAERVGQRHRSETSVSGFLDWQEDSHEQAARSLLAGHRRQSRRAGRALAAYVPRFYCKPLDEVFAAEVTEAEARLAWARMHGFPSWEVLRQRADAWARRRGSEWEVPPGRPAAQAIAAGDLDALRRVVEAHPELLHPLEEEEAAGNRLLETALHHERRQGSAAMRPIIEWLVAQGLDLQHELNRQLCGHAHITAEKVRWLLERGADPNWVAPNGIQVLEHALIRYWNAEAVDVLAARATPRRALWIAAGLGDVEGVSRFLDAEGRPTPAARRLRPDFVAAGPHGVPFHPDPGDEEILMEAFYVAVLNGRTGVMESMASRGFDVNTLMWETPLLNLAVGNRWTAVVECLIRCGADPDLGADPERKRSHTHRSAREFARHNVEQDPGNAESRRIAELCGLDPDAILAEPVTPPVMAPQLHEALELAGDDAFRLGQPDVRPENLLFGLLRAGRAPLYWVTQVSELDLDWFRADVAGRVRPATDRVEHAPLPMHLEAHAAIEAAIAIAAERRREEVEGLHLLYALTRHGRGAVAELLARYGASVAVLNTKLERGL